MGSAFILPGENLRWQPRRPVSSRAERRACNSVQFVRDLCSKCSHARAGLPNGKESSRAISGFNGRSFSVSQFSTLNSQLSAYSFELQLRCARTISVLLNCMVGKRCLLQIDPGPEEERIVAEEVARVPELAGEWRAAPSDYWASWRQECDLADRIIVNSEWSREGLMRSGVPREKLTVDSLGIRSVRSRRSEVRNHDKSDRTLRASRKTDRCACFSSAR